MILQKFFLNGREIRSKLYHEPMKFSTAKLNFLLIAIGVFLPTLWAQNEGNAEDKSWTATSSQSEAGTNPTRTTESHRELNGKTIDSQRLERLGAGGRYEPYLDTEKESTKVDDTTTRTVVRTYGRDPDGRRKLVQVTEEVAQELPEGGSRVNRSTSNPDANGRLQVVQREREETKKTGENSQETTKTITAPDANGRFVTAMKVVEQQTKSSETVTEVRTSTLLPDANGNLHVSEVREGHMESGDKTSSKSEQVSRADSEGRLSVVQKTVSHDSEGSNGEKRQVIETYSTQVAGKAGDARLGLDQRVTTISRSGSDGTTNTVRQTEQRDASGSGNGMQVRQKTIDIVRPGVNGGTRAQQQTVTVDTNGNSGTVWVDTRQSSKPPAAPAENKTPAPK